MGHTLKKHLQEREKPDTRSYRLCRKKEAKLKKKQQENCVITSAKGRPKIDYALQVAAENILWSKILQSSNYLHMNRLDFGFVK